MNSVPTMSAATLAGVTGDFGAGLTEPMTAERFRHLRAVTKLSFRDLATALNMRGRHAATHLREMADGVRSIPGPTAVALEAIALGLVDDQELTDLLSDAMSDAQDMDTGIGDLARAAVRALRDLLGRPGA